MKRQADWEEFWQADTLHQAPPVDRWAPWAAFALALVVGAVGAL